MTISPQNHLFHTFSIQPWETILQAVIIIRIWEPYSSWLARLPLEFPHNTPISSRSLLQNPFQALRIKQTFLNVASWVCAYLPPLQAKLCLWASFQDIKLAMASPGIRLSHRLFPLPGLTFLNPNFHQLWTYTWFKKKNSADFFWLLK